MKILWLGFILSITCAYPYTQDKVYKITILHTNDHHGRFWENKDGELGLAPRLTLIEQIRAEVKKAGGHTLLLDAGDVNTGIPQSDMLEAEPDFKGMKVLDYDVMAIGNHEFDQPLDIIFKQQKWAGFPFVSANIFYQNKDERPFQSHIFKKIEELNIGIMGLTTKDTPMKTNPKNVRGLVFKDPIEVAKKLVPEIRKQADVMIALTHMGHYPNESHGVDAPGDVTLARQVNGIDIIVGGHTQKPLFEADIQNGTIIVQAYEWGKYLGRIDLEFLNGKLTLKKYELLPINLKKKETVNGKEVVTYMGTPIKPDVKLLAMLAPYKAAGDKTLMVKIAESEETFIGERHVVRTQETNLGNMIAHAYKIFFNADLALVNSGGIRSSIAPGVINMETLLTVLPFGGEIVTIEMSGKELTEYLKKVVFAPTIGTGGFPQFSGLKVSGSLKDKSFHSLSINDKPLNSEHIYKIVMPEFVAKGGDNYPVLSTYKKYGYTDADIFKKFLSDKKKIKKGEFAVADYLDIKK
ncbi:MAG: 5'-nucleotidase C-terminal domain-containing protein [Bacteriovoracaceae bacterium]|nr:5'-nucleotidase C-terminal domain-containing protein [Bacteriovoracaceae bacterium]